jgi:thiol-disulfide isomerase/thioredoxin
MLPVPGASVPSDSTAFLSALLKTVESLAMHMFRAAITFFLLLLAATAPGISGADSALKLHTAPRTPPPLVLLDLAGKRHSLEDYRGKVVVVNFFGTWCPPCLQEMPGLLVLAEAWKDYPFLVLAVDVGDSPAKLRQTFGEPREAFTILLDTRQTASHSWGALAFPTSFVLDPEGRIRYSAEGMVAWDDPGVASQIVALMPTASSPPTDIGPGTAKEPQPAGPGSD